MHPFQVAGENVDSSQITSFFKGALSVRLVVVGTIIIRGQHTLFKSLLLRALSFLAPVFNLAACISVMIDVMYVAVIPISRPRPCSTGGVMRLAKSPWDPAGGQDHDPDVRLRSRELGLLQLLHLHHLEALDMRIDFHIILG
jgi:hypothetical protein